MDGKFAYDVESYLNLKDDDYEIISSPEMSITRAFNYRKEPVTKKLNDDYLKNISA